jgi:hypothetical protein
MSNSAKTLGVLLLLAVALPLNLAITGLALLRCAVLPSPRRTAQRPRTVLLSGGKMTKALHLARCFHRAGHRVILVESRRYRLTGHRFSRAVDRFHTVPEPGAPGYAEALCEIVRRERVDVFVPVCSPAASHHDAVAARHLAPLCEVLHNDVEAVDMLDDKYRFAARAAELGLRVPDTHRIESARAVEQFDFSHHNGKYLIKSIAYDPVNRLDLTQLPLATTVDTAAFARSKPISTGNPWIMQEFLSGTEFCTHGTVRDGHLQVYCCCRSSPFQVNYEMVDHPEIEAWVRRFVAADRLTGQVSFDFIQTPDGAVRAIECNPRTHSAITLFYNHPDLASSYLDDDVPVITPLPSSRPTYWLYHEMWRMLSDPRQSLARLRIILRGKEAIFDWSDPVPFLMVHHLHIPWLLLNNLVRLRPWLRIDFNIGKLVEPAGD